MNEMNCSTIEFFRFNNSQGIANPSVEYIRSKNNEPTQEVKLPIYQAQLDTLLKSFDHNLAGDNVSAALQRMDDSVASLCNAIEPFLGHEFTDQGSLQQIDLVIHAQELSQLPFEALERHHPNHVVTRRVRQTWPMPPVFKRTVPKVLYVWAGPRGYSVPWQQHLAALQLQIKACGANPKEDLEVVGNATRTLLEEKLAAGLYTHIHILAHGENTEAGVVDVGNVMDLGAPDDSPWALILNGASGAVDRCPVDVVVELLKTLSELPECITVASCFSADAEPHRIGGAFAHRVHACGVPIVLASQFALTKVGSVQIIDTFLANQFQGADPRVALHQCRQKLGSASDKTRFDAVALLAYIQLGDGYLDELSNRQLSVSLAKLKQATGRAQNRLAQVGQQTTLNKLVLTGEALSEIRQLEKSFTQVRDDLTNFEALDSIDATQRMEARGLVASAFKRQAESTWRLSQCISTTEQADWVQRSQQLLDEARMAYQRASRLSRDHHWSWVQWLALEGVRTGSLSEHRVSWFSCLGAASDAASRWEFELGSGDDSGDDSRDAITAGLGRSNDFTREQQQQMQDSLFAQGTLLELRLLEPLLTIEPSPSLPGSPDSGWDTVSSQLSRVDYTVLYTRLDYFIRCALFFAAVAGNDFPLTSTRDQFARYSGWWGTQVGYHALSVGVIQAADAASQRLTAKIELLHQQWWQ